MARNGGTILKGPVKARHDRMVELVERMLDLHKQLPKAKTPHEQESFKRTISATDIQIDAQVCGCTAWRTRGAR